MSQLLKCPNPSCSYVFDATGLPAGMVLVCPRCTMRFALGPLPSTAPQTGVNPAVPGGGPSSANFPAPAPGGSPVIAPPPAAVSSGPVPANVIVSPLDAANTPRRSVDWLKTSLLTLLVLGAIGLAGYAVYYNLNLNQTRRTDSALHYRDFNLALTPLGEPWVPADDLRAQLGSPVFAAYQREEPAAVVLLAARNFDKRNPRFDELEEILRRLLRRIVEADTLTLMPPEEQDQKWMGLDLKGYRFRAQARDDQSVISGQAYYAAHQGVAYWFIGWTSEAAYEQVKPEFAHWRSRCRSLGLRDNWQPTLPSAVPYKNLEVGYSFSDLAQMWKEETDEETIKARDPQADKYLSLKLHAPGQRRDLPKEAFLLVYVLPGGGEPLQVAREYVEDSRRQELRAANPDLKVEFQERTEPPEGEPPVGGIETAAPILRLRSTVKNALDQNRLHVLSAVRVADGRVVAMHVWCNWNDRLALEQMMIQIASTLRAEGGGQ
ncbi:MAG: hypothetical protein WHU94_08395 [Thermogemmata sp.]|uniref:Uncharacterized protein n=1 Tax=Thermogemmata fonticola TaxID=2755323 RepID=A0A7V8VH25_9BACT|nr:hypothetical protein [Thermogemmata fonticola]MBA2227792.1 hypothetical protein [Thermogemmata fonticola]MCX8138286.1 hypothetical protein [Gemmataceae bacterium]GIW83731.1 MAG: hypothetical protein KatS3mg106_244 [Gemmataceae bacterium]